MSGLLLIVFFIATIILMVLAMAKWKVHPFIAIMLASLLFGLVAGIPLVDNKEAGVSGLVTVIGQGFSGIFTSIGIVIILGAFIGAILEETGAALKLADMTIKLVGKNHPVLGMSIMGWIVSIPVFCDSGFVVLNPIRKALVRRTRGSSVAMTVALSAGLYISHVFMPPTPGPLASASTLGLSEHIALVMCIGLVCSIAPMIAGIIFANYIGKKVKADDEAEKAEIKSTYEELVASYGNLPSGLSAISPIIVPIILMALSSIIGYTGVEGYALDIVGFISSPVIALSFGAVLATFLLRQSGKLGELHRITEQTLKTVGPILFITAAGGVLGKVVSSSDLVGYVTSHADVLKGMGIFFPFLLAAILKSSMGSSTVAIITTAGILSPLMIALGFDTPIEASLVVMAISAGSMTVSHANDSYFWVVTNFGAMSMERGYKTQTMLTLVMGVAAILEIFLISLFV